jgi:hypothetical protein
LRELIPESRKGDRPMTAGNKKEIAKKASEAARKHLEKHGS